MTDFLANKGVAHPWECDTMGHWTTRYYVALFDDASYHFLQAVFGEPPAGFGWADVRHEIDYQDEVHAGTLLEVFGELIKLGGSSVRVSYTMRRLGEPDPVATLTSTSVYFDLKARTSAKLTDAMRQRAKGYVG